MYFILLRILYFSFHFFSFYLFLFISFFPISMGDIYFSRVIYILGDLNTVYHLPFAVYRLPLPLHEQFKRTNKRNKEILESFRKYMYAAAIA